VPRKRGRKRGGKLRRDEYVETNLLTGEARIRRAKRLKLW